MKTEPNYVYFKNIRMWLYPGLEVNIRSFFNEKFGNVRVSIVSGDVQRSEAALKTTINETTH